MAIPIDKTKNIVSAYDNPPAFLSSRAYSLGQMVFWSYTTHTAQPRTASQHP